MIPTSKVIAIQSSRFWANLSVSNVRKSAAS